MLKRLKVPSPPGRGQTPRRFGVVAIVVGLLSAALVLRPATDLAAQDDGAPALEVNSSRIVDWANAMTNVIVTLSVDTERSAIEIARLEDRIATLERRVAAFEQAAPEPAAN